MDITDTRIAELARRGNPVREISDILHREGTPLGKSAVAERLRRLRAAPAIPPGYAPPIGPGGPPRKIVHAITPETADLFDHGRAVYEPPRGWTPPAPTWDPATEEPWTLQRVRHEIASDPRVAACALVAGSVVDAAIMGGWWQEEGVGFAAPHVHVLLRALRHPYELARAVAFVTEYGEEREDGPAARGEEVPLEEQLRAGLAILAAAADELRAMAAREAARAAADGVLAFLASPDGWRRTLVEGRGVCDDWPKDTAEEDTAAAAE